MDTGSPIRIHCDRSSCKYRVGEQALFTIESPLDKPLTVTFRLDDGMVLSSLSIQKYAQIPYGLEKPGFLQCSAAAEGQLSPPPVGVAFSPEEIQPVLPEPEDFSLFWEKGLEELRQLPEDLKLSQSERYADEKSRQYELECTGLFHTKIHGFLKTPSRIEKPLPLLICIDGAGQGQCLEDFQFHTGQFVEKYLKGNYLSALIRVHPYPPAPTKKLHQAQYQSYLSSLGGHYWCSRMETGDPRQFFFYRAFLGCLQMSRLLAKLPSVAPERIVYYGESQAGAIGLFLLAYGNCFQAGYCGIPALSDCGGFLHGAHDVTCHIQELKKHYREMRYFDTSSFARRITVPAFLSTGFLDTTCSPTSVYAAANQVHSPLLFFDKINHGHNDTPVEYYPLVWSWLASHMGLAPHH